MSNTEEEDEEQDDDDYESSDDYEKEGEATAALDATDRRDHGVAQRRQKRRKKSGSRSRRRARRDKLCKYYENYHDLWASEVLVPAGVYTIEDLRQAAAKWVHPKTHKLRPFCPYFTARRLLAVANVVVLNYQYVLDPKVAQSTLLGQGSSSTGRLHTDTRGVRTLSIDVPPPFSGGATWRDSSTTNARKEPSVVVFDEAHNIDNVCIEALSVNINRATLDASSRNLTKLSEEIDRLRAEDAQRLNEEYERLVRGLQAQGQLDEVLAETLANPVLPGDVIEEALPGNIRKASHFVSLMNAVVAYLKKYVRVYEVKSEGPRGFMFDFERMTGIDPKMFKFCYERLKSLLNVLQVNNLDEFTPLTLVADICTLIGTYAERTSSSRPGGGFVIICEPYPEATGLYDPVFQLCCLDASLAMRPVLERYQSVVLTSGTISPLELYPKLLGFHPVLTESFPMSLDRNCICPLIITRGADQVPLSSKFELRTDAAVARNYGNLVVDLTKTIPDGMVCFFTSYTYMEQVISHWYDSGVLSRVLENKLIFMETKDVVATTLALHNFRKACDCGRGAVFFSVARGKVAEGIDFDRHYGRCVVLFGVPFQYTLSKVLKARLDFMREQFQLQESEFLTFDAMRQAAQCVGRVIRSKSDYGLMIFADARYSRMDKRSKLPPWILKYLDSSNISLTTQTAVSAASQFLRNMSQPYAVTRATRLDSEALKNPEACWEAVRRILSLSNFAVPLLSLGAGGAKGVGPSVPSTEKQREAIATPEEFDSTVEAAKPQLVEQQRHTSAYRMS